MNVLAEKTGRRPSMAEMAQDFRHGFSGVPCKIGDAVFRVSLLSTLFTIRSELELPLPRAATVEIKFKRRRINASETAPHT